MTLFISVGLLALAGVVLGLALARPGAGHVNPAKARAISATMATHTAPHAAGPPYGVGIETVRLTEPGRTIELPNGAHEPRSLVTYVRYPTLGGPRRVDLRGAPAAHARGPFPLIVFGHGFAVTPELYKPILQSWARAGYVVAAPVFPLENADAPGGPNESDLVNQPQDMRFVISSMLEASRSSSSKLAGLINPAQVAVAGQSDGGDTALAVAYDKYFRDPRVKAAVILSGAEMPGVGGFEFQSGEAPLLATQGTADTVNLPSETQTFFEAARAPKYLLSLTGAEHLPPYSYEQPQLGIVERTTTAFLDDYLAHRANASTRLRSAGHVPGVATLIAQP
jgi:predicted dienelactone hydrolase